LLIAPNSLAINPKFSPSKTPPSEPAYMRRLQSSTCKTNIF
jgi:hypothetical protein